MRQSRQPVHLIFRLQQQPANRCWHGLATSGMIRTAPKHLLCALPHCVHARALQAGSSCLNSSCACWLERRHLLLPAMDKRSPVQAGHASFDRKHARTTLKEGTKLRGTRLEQQADALVIRLEPGERAAATIALELGREETKQQLVSRFRFGSLIPHISGILLSQFCFLMKFCPS